MAQVKQTPARRARPRKVDTCQQATSLIVDYITGALDPETALAFEQHLRDCPDCVAFLNTYKKTIQATRSLHSEEIPLEMRSRVQQFLREKIARSSRSR